MNLDQFFVELQNASKKFKWYYHTKVSNSNRIRAKGRWFNRDKCFCPVTAVYFAKTNHFVPHYLMLKAGLELGLNIEDISDLQKAADVYPDASPEIRQKLEEAVKIHESE